MSIADVKKTTEHKMQKSLEALRHDLAKVRTGRAHTGLLDHVQVDYYGTMTPINAVANVTMLDPRTLGVQAWEKGMTAKIEKAIRDSDLGLNPAAQGELIRVPMPALTEERRKQLVKQVSEKVEEARIAMRTIRQDALKDAKRMKDAKELGEDDYKRVEKEIDALMSKVQAQIDEAFKAKEKDVLTV